MVQQDDSNEETTGDRATAAAAAAAAPLEGNETDNEWNATDAVSGRTALGFSTSAAVGDTNTGSTVITLTNPLALEASSSGDRRSNHPALNEEIHSLVDAKLAIAAANAETEANSSAPFITSESLVAAISPNLSGAEALLEAKASIAVANAVAKSAAQSSDAALREKAKEEEQPSPEDDNNVVTNADNDAATTIIASPSSASEFPEHDTHTDQPQQQLPNNDEYASLPTMATARAVSAFTVNSSPSANADDETAAAAAAAARENERALFRQQVRDSLAAQAVQAEPLQRPEVSLTNDGNDNDNANGIVFRRKRQRRLLFVTALGIVVLVSIVTITSVLATRNNSGGIATQPSGSNPTTALETIAPSASPTTIPVVFLPDGRQAFTETWQLYQAVDDYDEAIQVNETAEGSLVAIQYGYPMGKWDVSRLTDFSRVFMVNRSQGLYPLLQFSTSRTLTIPDLSGWDVSQATTMRGMFFAAIFFTGEGIADWQVGQVTDFSYCFSQANAFSEDVSKWNTTGAISMEGMFYECTNFNGDLSSWDVSNVEKMRLMFFYTITFQGGDMTRWNVSQVRDMKQMFGLASAFDGNISTWDTRNVVSLVETFLAANTFNGDLSSWNVEKVTSMDSLFFGATAFVGGDLSRWNTSQVLTMKRIFNECDVFNGSISTWDVSKVQDLELGFERCFAFNGDLSQWNTGAALSMRQTFKDAWAFTGDLSSWITSNVTDMFEMSGLCTDFLMYLFSRNSCPFASFLPPQFHNADAFNGNLSNWDVSNVQNASRMFAELEVYNQSLCAWRHKLPTSAVTIEMFNLTGCANTSDPSLMQTTTATALSTSFWTGPFCSVCDDKDDSQKRRDQSRADSKYHDSIVVSKRVPHQ